MVGVGPLGLEPRPVAEAPGGLVVAAGAVVHQGRVTHRHGTAGMPPLRLAHELHRLVVAARGGEERRIAQTSADPVGIETERALVGGFRGSPIPVVVEPDRREDLERRNTLLDPERRKGGLAGGGKRLVGGKNAVLAQPQVGVREAGVGESEPGILPRGVAEVLDASPPARGTLVEQPDSLGEGGLRTGFRGPRFDGADRRGSFRSAVLEREREHGQGGEPGEGAARGDRRAGGAHVGLVLHGRNTREEAIAPARHRLHEPRRPSVVAQHAPDPVQAVVQAAILVDVNAVTPQDRRERVSRHDVAAADRQLREHREGLGGQGDQVAAAPQLARVEVHVEGAEAQQPDSPRGHRLTLTGLRPSVKN